ncbi:MAG: hypothetical protein FD152_2111 [Xanthobacteraceae bacterium]|nr:MAG: hypothetical protein FD152_2111 [Xanthobacteraceae bacterium]
MTFGARLGIRNSSGEVQVDQNFFNIEVFAEGALTSPGGGYDNLLTLSFSGILNPMVFVKMAVNGRYFFGPTTNSTFWMSTNLGSGVSIPYKLCGFRPDPTVAPSGDGIKVHRPGSNEVAFASPRKYLRLINSIQVIDQYTQHLLRGGDWYDYDTDNNGIPYKWYYEHPTKPIPLDTYWLATMTGLANRPNSVNSTPYVLERKSTIRYEFRSDGVITIGNREAMGLPDGTSIQVFANYLVAA